VNRDPDRKPGAGSASEVDVSKIRTVPMEGRLSKVSTRGFATPPVPGASFGVFLESLPDLLEADSLRAVAGGVARAAGRGKGVLWMLGGHTIKTGLAPLFVRMMDRGAAGFFAGNGSVAVHDYEVARWGATSEDVEAGLADGTFGMAEETGQEMNEAISRGAEEGMGFGEALGWALSQRRDLVAPKRSLLLQGYRRGIPVGIHSAMGCEIIHQHPAADGGAIGACSMRDFRRLAQWLPSVHGGGAVLNLGSAVIMPEVFLKALTVARNVHDGRPQEFLAADFDMIRQYRPWMNVVQRPTRSGGGQGYRLTGHHEIMIPLLVWAVEESLAGLPSLGPDDPSFEPPGPDGSESR
jgi:hypothetical protein